MNPVAHSTKIITFYSYKGGTGRSMALANVAWILASNGKRVLILDWDLEAPGIHRYVHPFLQDKELTSSEGIIDFVIDFAAEAATSSGRSSRSKKKPDEWYLPQANILRYASSLDWAFPRNGTLDFVPAGRQGPDYATRVNSFQWKNFYELLGGGIFLEAAKEHMADYDYVLIDSRTGVSDTSGICTVQMPDLLVICFTYNTQSIEGALAVAESADLQRKKPDGKSGLRIFPVPMRVELAEKQKLESARDLAWEKFAPFLWHIPPGEQSRYWGQVEVLYQPFYAFEEVLATFGDKPFQTKSVLSSMEAITNYLTDGAITSFPSLPDEQRNEVLFRYRRRTKPASPKNEWMKFAPSPKELSQEKKWHVFLSYRAQHRSWVLSLYNILRELGYKVFLDQEVLMPGDQLTTRLDEALNASQAGILIWPDATTNADWVAREFAIMERVQAHNKDFQFVPIKLDNSQLPMFANNRIFLDFRDYPDGPNGGMMLRLLYAISGLPLSEEAIMFANQQDEAAMTAAARVAAAIKNNRPERLVQLFEEDELPWRTSSVLGCKAADGLIRLGRLEEAILMLEKIGQRFPKSIRPKQLQALALARQGQEEDLDYAQEILGELYETGERDPETLGIYGRTWMDRYAKSGNPDHLREARDIYVEAFELSPDDYYTGINAASASLLLGSEEDLNLAAWYAQQVQSIVGTEPIKGDYWKTATIAEIALIRKNFEEAGKLYQEAISMARSETGSHLATWTQACRLMDKLQPTAEERAMIKKPFAHLPDYYLDKV